MRTTLVATSLSIALAACGSSGGGGPTPTVVPSPTPTPQPRLFALVAAGTDPGAAFETRLLSSDDLGATWTVLDQGGLADTTVAIAFADREHGVAAGATLVQRTDDGGRTWTTQLSDDRHAPDDHLEITDVAIDPSGAAVAFGNLVNDSYVNAAGFAAWLLPADGGTPEPSSIASGGIAPVGSICVSPDGAAVAAGAFRFTMALVAYNTVLVSGDGGVSWTLGPSSLIGNGGAVDWTGTACSGSGNLWLVGAASVGGVILPSPPSFAIAHSSDGGATWVGQSVADAPAGSLSEVTFVDDRNGWLVGSTDFHAPEGVKPVVAHTSDGGDSWALQALPADASGSLGDVAFLDGDLGVAGGVAFADTETVAPLLFVTEDGGDSWRRVDLPAGFGAARRVAIAR